MFIKCATLLTVTLDEQCLTFHDILKMSAHGMSLYERSTSHNTYKRRTT